MVQILSTAFAFSLGVSLVQAQELRLWSQCGGVDFTGQGECPSGATCHTYNPYYAQCIPIQTGITTTPTPTTRPQSCSTLTSCTSFRDCCTTVTQCKSYCPGYPPSFTTPRARTCTCPQPWTSSTTTPTPTTSCASITTCIAFEGLPCCQGITQIDCKTYCPGQTPAPFTRRPYVCACPTPSTTSSSCATTTSTCTSFEGLPCCAGVTQTECRKYCAGQTPPPISITRYLCSCRPTTTAIQTRGIALGEAEKRWRPRQEECTCPMSTYYTTYPLCCGNYGTETGSVCRGSPRTTIPVPLVKCAPTCPSSTPCPMSTYYTTFPLCCGNYGTETGSVCRGSPRTTIPVPLVKCAPTCPSSTSCPLSTYYATYPLCCGASGTATGSVCSGSRTTRIPTPVVRCASCTTGGVTFATAIVTRVDTIKIRT